MDAEVREVSWIDILNRNHGSPCGSASSTATRTLSSTADAGNEQRDCAGSIKYGFHNGRN